MPNILLKWEELINTILNPLVASSNSMSEQAIESLIAQSALEKKNVSNLLIEEVIDRHKAFDRQQYVQVVQTMLILLSNKLHYFKQVEGLNENLLRVCNSINQHLQETLSFIEDFFSDYFDRNAKIPATYLIGSIAELSRQFEELKSRLKLSNPTDIELNDTLVNHFNTFCTVTTTGPTYNELLYEKHLMQELLAGNVQLSDSSIRDVLFYFNFNHDEFVSYLLSKLKLVIECTGTNNEKIAILRYEQKNMNQSRTKLNFCYSQDMPSLKDQVNSWVEEEIKYLQAELNLPSVIKKEDERENKIQTSLSVSRLALLIRLMVIDKVITNRILAQVLRTVIKTVATAHSENISLGSFQSKYHQPDKGTVVAVKDLLFRWINILNELSGL